LKTLLLFLIASPLWAADYEYVITFKKALPCSTAREQLKAVPVFLQCSTPQPVTAFVARPSSLRLPAEIIGQVEKIAGVSSIKAYDGKEKERPATKPMRD
jgi:hypothetical protein